MYGRCTLVGVRRDTVYGRCTLVGVPRVFSRVYAGRCTTGVQQVYSVRQVVYSRCTANSVQQVYGRLRADVRAPHGSDD